MQFLHPGEQPLYKLLCVHKMNDEGNGTCYLKHDALMRAPNVSGCSFLAVEVMFAPASIRTDCDLRSVFKDLYY